MTGEVHHGLELAAPLVFLGAAVIAVPLFRVLKLGAVIGYIAAGVVVGPSVLGLIDDPGSVLTFAELGVVLLLFIIGLELKPSRLWAMRRDIAGLGLGQVLACWVVLGVGLWALGLSLPAAVIGGAGLALSSTAFAVPLLEARNDLAAPYGQRAFAILLLQDLSIVPLLALVGLLGEGGATSADATPAWLSVVMMIGAVGAVIVVGRFALNPLFKILARSGAGEIMTAAALLVVLGAAALMQFAGLSMAMGAFLAGVLLAESRFRHELEADIEPFRGLLLGLFFIAVGMGLDLRAVLDNLPAILLGVAGVILAKAGVILLLARSTGSGWRDALKLGAVLSQGGEFAFVLFAAAAAGSVMPTGTAAILTAVVTLSMAVTPLMVALAERIARGSPGADRESDFRDARGTALVIGFGRVGQVVSQLLMMRGVEVIMIDSQVEAIDAAGRYGMEVHYGDGSRIDLLKAAGAAKAELICVCIDDAAAATRIVDIARAQFPMAKLFVRSADRNHGLELAGRDVDYHIRETFESAVKLGEKALEALGMTPTALEVLVRTFRQRDRERFERQLAGGVYAGLDLVQREAATPSHEDKDDGRSG